VDRPPSERWHEIEVANDRAVADSGQAARMIFGLGPAQSVTGNEARMLGIVEALAPGLQAIRWGEQVHGAVVRSLASRSHDGCRLVGCVGRCDALMTSAAGLGLVVWTADCVPILISGGSLVAAVHSGWRGAAIDVTGTVVRRFESEFGISPRRLRVSLGPAISGPRYPVGSEVVDALRRFGIDESRWLAGRHVDLRGFVKARLESCGLAPASITFVGGCTASSTDLASYRRDGAAAGRQWSLIYRPAIC